MNKKKNDPPEMWEIFPHILVWDPLTLNDTLKININKTLRKLPQSTYWFSSTETVKGQSNIWTFKKSEYKTGDRLGYLEAFYISQFSKPCLF